MRKRLFFLIWFIGLVSLNLAGRTPLPVSELAFKQVAGWQVEVAGGNVENRALVYMNTLPAQEKKALVTTDAPSTVSESGVFKLTFSFQGDSEDVKLSPTTDFKVLAGPSTNLSVKMVDGNVVKTSKFIYFLQPIHKGDFALPSLTVRMKGQTMTSEPRSIKVVEESILKNIQETATKEDSVLVRAIVDKTSIRKGESVLFTLKVYTLGDVNLKEVSLLDFPYCYIEEQTIPESRKYSSEYFQSRDYKTVEYRQFRLIPLQEGVIHIRPIQFVFEIRQSIASAEDLFDAFFNTNMRTIEKKELTNAITIEVKP